MSEILQTITNSVAKNLRSEDGIDMLSNLPDSILCHIISNLETREAVKTSLLSSRYKSLWMDITSLSLDDSQFGPQKLRFAHFVNRVLFVLKPKSINSLFLALEIPLEIYDVSFWFSAAIGMNVKVLRLHFHEPLYDFGDHSISMPACLYTSKTLEVLGIWAWSSRTLILNVPEFVSLPKLTKLELLFVNYSSDDSVRRLISGCSYLEHLCIARDVFDDVGTFTIDCPTLKFLNYNFMSVQGFVGHDFKFELNAPALIDLQFLDWNSSEFSVVNLCSLEHAEIEVSSPKTVDIDSHCERVVQIIQGVYGVNHLWISGVALEALMPRSPPDSPQNSSISNVRDSLVIMDTIKVFQDYFKCYDDFCHLYLSKDSPDTTHVVQWRAPKVLPVCLLSCLETISVSGFRGRDSEVGMIAYILKNAKLLKKMIISEAKVDANFELHQKILKFDQGSGRCEITFENEDDGGEDEMKRLTQRKAK